MMVCQHSSAQHATRYSLAAWLQVQEMYAAALTEDPTVFDYDGVYDSIQEQKTVPKQRDKVTRQPKYIASLLEQAATRKREQDITFERQLVSCSHSAAVGCSCCP